MLGQRAAVGAADDVGQGGVEDVEAVPRMTASTSAVVPSTPTTVLPRNSATPVACTSTLFLVSDWR